MRKRNLLTAEASVDNLLAAIIEVPNDDVSVLFISSSFDG